MFFLDLPTASLDGHKRATRASPSPTHGKTTAHGAYGHPLEVKFKVFSLAQSEAFMHNAVAVM
jgi:hypothetical protein